MTQSADFPFDLKNIITDCLLSLIWVKADIIQFFSECDVTATELEIVRGNGVLTRKQIIQDVFSRLSLREDRGTGPFEKMLSRLSEWNYFNPHWFEREKKLDRNQAENRLAELRRMVGARHAAKANQSVAVNKGEKLKEDGRALAALKDEFTSLAIGGMKPQQRGHVFEGFLRKVFAHFGIAMTEPFRITGEEIDGCFKFEGENYIVEAKWQDPSISTGALYKFAYKVEGKMYGRGMFISVNAFSWEGIESLVKNKHISTILMDGIDLMYVLDGVLTLNELIDKKVRAAQTRGDVYVDPISGQSKSFG